MHPKVSRKVFSICSTELASRMRVRDCPSSVHGQPPLGAAEALASGLLARVHRHEKGLYRRGLAREAQGNLEGVVHDRIDACAASSGNAASLWFESSL